MTNCGKSSTTPDDKCNLLCYWFIAECQFLQEKAPVEVFVCAPPAELLNFLDAGLIDAPDPTCEEEAAEEDDAEEDDESATVDFHDLLKARGLNLKKPIQMVRPETYDENAKRGTRDGETRRVQDPATRAWNFHTALYYKAGGIPWRC